MKDNKNKKNHKKNEEYIEVFKKTLEALDNEWGGVRQITYDINGLISNEIDPINGELVIRVRTNKNKKFVGGNWADVIKDISDKN